MEDVRLLNWSTQRNNIKRKRQIQADKKIASVPNYNGYTK